MPNVEKFQSGDLRRAEYSDSKRKHSENQMVVEEKIWQCEEFLVKA